ncbi:MAG: hypothetical protein CHACPFDD_01431 [Phycisphaerae bacterium]|nr:hypothetical protein [Phycisphaerae bacterium]
MRRFGMLVLFTAVIVGGCPQNTSDQTGGTTDGNNTGGTTDGNNTGGTGDTSTALTISGQLTLSNAAKARPRGENASGDFGVVVAQSAETGEIYRATPDAEGNFVLELPEDEKDGTMIVTVLGPDGRSLGPVMMDADGPAGVTGMDMTRSVDLGQMVIPDDLSADVLAPGADSDVGSDVIADDVTVRLDDNGVPVGVPNIGKGDDSLTDAPTNNPNQAIDKDQDGLIDPFDADDDGDGTIDDFDTTTTSGDGAADGIQLNFFMNLKIDDATAEAFFPGDNAGIQKILRDQTVITFEIRGTNMLSKNISAARILAPPNPAPAYLPNMTAQGVLWSTLGYALRPDVGVNHFQEWAVPTAIMNAGDTFTAEVTYDDASTGVYTRMINFVFHSIPKLIKHGPPGTLTDYTGPGVITYDGTQDLVLEWNPPVDETGRLLVGLTYFFEVFYYDSGNAQINDIDGSATWPTAPTGFDSSRRVFEVAGSTLTTLSPQNSFSVQLPKEIFPDTVQTGSGAVGVTSYKVDIAAQSNGNNAALMIRLQK